MLFFFSSRRRHTRFDCDWSSDVCSSDLTGHLLLMQRFFGFGDDDFGKSFAILIQFGAILALLSIYAMRLWQLFIGMFDSPQARRFILGVLIAFLPAAVVGALAYKLIKEVL